MLQPLINVPTRLLLIEHAIKELKVRKSVPLVNNASGCVFFKFRALEFWHG